MIHDTRYMRFTHLHTHTHYSLLDGLSRIDELIAKAKEMNMEALAITDHGVMYGAIEFYKKAKKAGIKPIIGCEVYISVNSMHDKRPNIDDKRYHLILLAKNNTGYKNLIKIVSAAHLEGFYYKPRVDKDFLRKHSDGLIALSACLGGELSRAIASKNYDKAKKIALEHEEIFGKGNYYIELQQHPHIEDQNNVTPQLVKLARETGIPLVATQDSHYTHSDDAHAHDVLLAVQTGNKLDDTDRLSMKDDDFSLLAGQKMYEKFISLGEDVVKEAFDNTNKIAGECNLEIELGKTKLPPFPLPENYRNTDEYLKKLVYDGLVARYDNNLTDEIKTRLEYELKIITQTGFAS
jgi:DNA polymerase III subunit alpha